MHSLIAAQAFVQFVGLCTFFPSTGIDPTVHAALVNVVRHNRYNVEEHQAIIAFRPDQVMLIDGWDQDPVPLPGDADVQAAGWRYLRLNGEQLTFSGIGDNPDPHVPDGDDNTGLPHLGKVCGSMGRLNAGYRPPTFTAAAAVVHIRYGDLKLHHVNGRSDTLLTLNTKGPFVVTAKTKEATRVLVLRPDSCLVIGNIPKSYLAGTPAPLQSASHLLAYNAMGDDIQNVACHLHNTQAVMARMAPSATHPPTLPAKAARPLLTASNGALVTTRRLDDPPAPSGPCDPMPFEVHVMGTAFINAECSNTQWP